MMLISLKEGRVIQNCINYQVKDAALEWLSEIICDGEKYYEYG